MALTNHVGILLGHSFDVARLNKKRTRSDFYAQFAFPPAALNDLAALVGAIYPGVPLNTLEVNILPNAQQSKPFPGVPADWYVVRCASQFAPELYGADGALIPTAEARSRFFAGMKVRLHSSAWSWKNEFGKSGASFNLLGVMDAGQGGERLAIGNGANGSAAAFGGHANPNAVSAPTTQTANPFGAAVAQVGQSVGAGAGMAQNATGFAAPAGNPFGGAPAQSANPFAQQTSANANPFAASA